MQDFIQRGKTCHLGRPGALQLTKKMVLTSLSLTNKFSIESVLSKYEVAQMKHLVFSTVYKL